LKEELQLVLLLLIHLIV